MDEVIELAEKLGEALSRHERFKTLRDLEEQVSTDEECKRILEDFQKKSASVREKEANMQPVEVSEKRELSDAEDKFRKNDLLQKFLRAQVDYTELINKVNQQIFGKLKDEEK